MSRPYSPLLTPTLLYPLPQVGTRAVQHSFKPFPSSPPNPLEADKPLTQSLEAPTATIYHDNRLAVPPFKQTSDERYHAPENVGVRANLVGMGQAGGSVHRSGHAVEAFGDTETYHTPGDLNAASQLHSEYPPFLAASPNTIESAVHVSTHSDTAPATEVSGHSHRSISRAHSAVDVRMPAVATLAVCHDNVGTDMVPIWGASPNFTSYANLHQPDPDYGGAPDSCSRARSGRDALVDPGRRPLFEEEAGSSRHQSHYAPPSSHCPHSHQSQNVVGELQSSTELASLSRSGSGSTTSVAPNLLVVGRCAHDAPAADSDPHHDLSVLHSRQLATPIRNILDHDGACHGFVSLSGHDANFNSLRSLGLGNASSSATREHGEARVYMGGVHGIGELKPRPSRPTLVVPSPPPAPPTIPTDREQEEKDLLETFFGSRSRVLKIIQPTVSSSLPIIIQCVSRVTTAMRDSCTSSPIVYTARPASRFPSSPLSRAPRSPFMPQRIFSGSNSSTASPASSSAGLLSPYSPFGAGGLKTPEDLARPLRPSSGLGLDKLDEEVYVMYASHEEATHAMDIALATPSLGLSVAPALMSDLERPGVQIYRFDEDGAFYSRKMAGLGNGVNSQVPITVNDAVLKSSGNVIKAPVPVKATTTATTAGGAGFRAGDWLCTVHGCKTHNFSRNMVCYGCGSPRHSQQAHFPNGLPNGLPTGPTAPQQTMSIDHHSAHPAPLPPTTTTAPRFNAPAATPPPQRTRPYPPPPPPMDATNGPMHSPRDPGFPPNHVPVKPPAPSYPLLTPSGHALASGGRVRNISVDPLNPCVMYWPDNEPLPERGQIRPTGSVVVQYPPIINTGNKGAAEKQPGDWTCSKCNYLNWRRRKVCQTCYPYAEGNGDSISQAVQAERIALLTNVLNQVNDPISPLPLPLQQFTSSGQHQQPSPLGQQHQQFGVGNQHQSQQLPPHLHRRASAPLNTHHQPGSPFVGYPQNYPLPPQYGGMGGSGPTTPAPVPTLNGSAAARARSQNDLRGLLRSEHQLQYHYDGALREEVQPPRMGLHHHRSATAIYQTASQTPNHPSQYSQNGFVGGGYGGYGAQRSPTGTSSTRSHGSQVPSPTSSSGHGFAFAEEEQNLGVNAAGADTGITPSAPSLLPGFLQDMVKVQGSYSTTNSNSNSHRVNNNNGNSNGRASHSIHSSPSTSTSESSWSLDEFDSPSSLAFDHPHYPHPRHHHVSGGGAPSTPSYEHYTPAPFEHESSLSLFSSQVSLGARSNGNGGLPSAPSVGQQQQQQQGPGVIGRPPRLSRNTSSATSGNGAYVSRSNSSGSVASGGGALSIWQMDGEERQEEDEVKADEIVSGTWKPASAIRSGSGNGVYNGGHRGLGGLEELAARLAISKREVGV